MALLSEYQIRISINSRSSKSPRHASPAFNQSVPGPLNDEQQHMAGCFSSSSSRSPPLVRTSRPTIHQKRKRRSCGDTILGQNRTKSRVLDIERKVTISSIDCRRRRSLDGMLAQGIGGETQRARTPSIASRHSHSVKEDDDEGGSHDCFYCSRSSW
jgi:hypothetical protein